jgi:hypothetical protein
MSDEDRRWEEACAKYAALSEAQIKALSNNEMMEALVVSFPEAKAYARAWYAQRPAEERFNMRMKSVLELVETWLAEERRVYASGEPWVGTRVVAAIALLELDRRTRSAGYTRIGQWLLAQGEWGMKKRGKA